MRIAEVVFWIATALLVHGSVGYPAYIWLRSRLGARAVRKAPITPAVTCVLAARNEAAAIREKLANLEALDYPRDRLEVVVVDDGSTDGTGARVAGWVRATSLAARLVTIPERRGKAHGLNAGVAAAGGEIVVFLDARQRVAVDAVRLLVESFADPRVGAVSGELSLDTHGAETSARGLGRYWSFERWLRRAESVSGSTIGCTGALYAIRRGLYRPIPEQTLLDDVLIPLRVVLGGRRVVVEERARVFDRLGGSRREFQRKVRTLAGNIQLLRLCPGLLDPRRPGLAGRFVSHKLLPRVAMPYCLAALLVSSLALEAPLYRVALAGQVAVYLAGALGLVLRRRGRLLAPAAAFVMLNAASVVASVAYLAPGRRDLWDGVGARRQRPAA